MSFQRYQKISSAVQKAKPQQEKTAVVEGLADLAKSLNQAFAAAGRSPGPRPPSQGFHQANVGDAFDALQHMQGSGVAHLSDALTLARDEGALRQKSFENQLALLKMEQDGSQRDIQNALSLRNDTRASGRDAREVERHGLEMERLRGELAPSEWFNAKNMLGDGSNFQSAFGSGIGGGLAETVMSPLSGLSRGIETAISAPGTTFGYRLDKALNSGLGGLMDRIKAPDIAAERFIESMSGNMADKATDLLADMTSKAMSSLTDTMVNSPARKAILDQLRKEDAIISLMGEQELMDAYHSIAKYAPTLATDKNAVRSALRQAAQFEGGLDYMTIKGLAEAEQAVSGKR